MEISKKWLPVILLACVLVSAGTAGFVASYFTSINANIYGETPLSFSMGSIHAKVTFYKDGVKIHEFYHAGAVTKLGLNATLGKLTGNSTFYNMTQYNLNTTFVGIGNQGTLNTDSTILPGEWNRTSGTQHTLAYNSFNITAVFTGITGSQTADCLGLYYESAGNSLWGYDTFAEVTGIDSTFTITIEIQVSAS